MKQNLPICEQIKYNADWRLLRKERTGKQEFPFVVPALVRPLADRSRATALFRQTCQISPVDSLVLQKLTP